MRALTLVFFLFNTLFAITSSYFLQGSKVFRRQLIMMAKVPKDIVVVTGDAAKQKFSEMGIDNWATW